MRWAETIESGADIVMSYEDGAPLLVKSDGMHYLAGWPDQTLWLKIIGSLAETCGLEIQSLPEGVRVRNTATHRFLFNYGPNAIHFNGVDLPPAGVHWEPRTDE